MPRKILKRIARYASPFAKTIEGVSRIRTRIKKNRMISSVARQHVKKKYPRGGREGMQSQFIKERRRLKKAIKRK